MHDLVLLGNKIVAASEAKIPAISNLNFYGKGVFSTIAIYDSAPFLFDKHWSRLSSNAAKLGLDLSGFEEEKLFVSLSALIECNRVLDGKCRITFFDESVSPIWNGADGGQRKVSLLIQTADLGAKRHHISLTFSPFPVNSLSPLAGVKSCNYLENILALESALANGFDEAVRINERGFVTSACMANIFWIKDGKLFTPSLKTGCLAGTTREFILETREVLEVEEGAGFMSGADHIFLTSAGIGITQIGNFEDREFSRDLHEITQIIENAL